MLQQVSKVVMGRIPGKTSHELLKELHEAPDRAEISVVVFTSSMREEDRTLSQALQAVDYMQKPQDVDKYFACVQCMIRT